MAVSEALRLAYGAVFCGLLYVASASDLRTRTIPNSICAAIALAGLISLSPAKLLGVFAALPLLIAAMIRPDSMGGGDIKLTAAAGIHVGIIGGIAAVILGLFAAALYAVASGAICTRRKRERPRALPLAPFLSIGFTAVYILQ